MTDEQSKINSHRERQIIFYRGFIVDRLTRLEHIIEATISHYFCDSEFKATELQHRLICNSRLMSFDTKIILLEYIIKSHYTDFEARHRDLIPDIREIQEDRNIVAHRKVLTNETYLAEYNKNDIAFENFETKSHKIKLVSKVFNRGKLKILKVKCDGAIVAISELMNTIMAKSADNKNSL